MSLTNAEAYNADGSFKMPMLSVSELRVPLKGFYFLGCTEIDSAALAGVEGRS
ncbi:hypothetical protein [Amycolatopsis mediterranei]|uniref:hypothetical protein n=1 Tax=Amycolatopsis mediterranei TaxID=33910 RepID=UPI000ADDB9DD|nr:hypothetical protein [Amycolatopsis mediterranei]UZF74059.1 hypothetical protein ISP_007542 [Amycolatopsis mediterranei]